MKRIWKLFTFIILILIIVGIVYGVTLSLKKEKKSGDETVKQIFSKVQLKYAEVSEFFTYGTSLNFSCSILGINKDNYESARLIITDGKDFEKVYKLYTKFEDDNLKITTSEYINDAVKLEELDEGEYFILIRVKVNNSSNEKYYLLNNSSKYENFEYYTISKNSECNKICLKEKNYSYNKHDYEFLKLYKDDPQKNDNIYDIVIDAGHGGNDKGNIYKNLDEANITLDFAYSLKDELEKNNFKVKLTRTNENTKDFAEKNNYDSNGRIALACSSKAKYMLSLHMSDGTQKYSGVEVYCPSKSKLDFATKLVKNITDNTSLEYSNDGNYKVSDGVYVYNFNNERIKQYALNAEKGGYENYNLTTDTPALFTIREVGGIATNAFIDGRNKFYGVNKYYNSNQGIECYELHLGYMKNDIEKIQNEKEQYVNAIVKSILEELK